MLKKKDHISTIQSDLMRSIGRERPESDARSKERLPTHLQSNKTHQRNKLYSIINI